MKKLFPIISLLLIVGFFTSCNPDKWLEPTLKQDKSIEASIKTVEDVKGLLLGAYNGMQSSDYYGRDIIIYGEIRADNCFANGNSGRFLAVSAMKMQSTDGYARATWRRIYRVIANANIVIAQKDKQLDGDANEMKQYIEDTDLSSERFASFKIKE